MKRLGCVEWTEVYETVDVIEAYNKFTNIFINLYNNCFPIVKFKCRNNKDKPWITNGIRNPSRKKNYLYKIFIKKHKKLSVLLFFPMPQPQYDKKLLSKLYEDFLLLLFAMGSHHSLISQVHCQHVI